MPEVEEPERKSQLKKLTVTIFDTVVGDARDVDKPFDEFWWSDGNGSCDCNRAVFMDREDFEECTQKRFLVLPLDKPKPTALECVTMFNEGYPAETIALAMEQFGKRYEP